MTNPNIGEEMNQEAIALLKKAQSVFDSGYTTRGHEYINQAIAILKQPKCETCNDTKKRFLCQSNAGSHYDDCPDCQQPKDQPSSEFTKECQKHICVSQIEGFVPYCVAKRLVYLLCDRLDTSEQQRKDLLEACKGLMEKADNGSADFDDPEPGSIYLRAEAAIAKAEKEGE